MLNDLLVVELASVLAGPLCGSFFAELGARVIKVEHPERGDVTRSWKLRSEDQKIPVSAYFASANYGKEYLSLDLSKANDRAELLHLLKKADILLSNFKKGDTEKFNLTDLVLQSVNPALIHGKITGFGENSDRTAFDLVLQAECGWISMTGTPGYPAKMPVALIDVMAAHQLKEGLLLALLQRSRTNKGATVSVSLQDTAISALTNQATNYLMAGQIARPEGTLHPNIAPYGEVLRDKNNEALVLAVGSSEQFAKLCQVLGIKDLISDPRFLNNQLRVTHRVELHTLLNQAFQQKKAREWQAEFEKARIPSGLLKSLDEVLESDAAQKLLLSDETSGYPMQRLKTAVFSIRSW